ADRRHDEEHDDRRRVRRGVDATELVDERTRRGSRCAFDDAHRLMGDRAEEEYRNESMNNQQHRDHGIPLPWPPGSAAPTIGEALLEFKADQPVGAEDPFRTSASPTVHI